MNKHSHSDLSRRERQIMDIIYQNEKATSAEVMEELPDPPSYSAVRALLRILEEKGHLRHEKDGPRYVFYPTVSAENAQKTALHHVVSTFFHGSITGAVAALMDLPEKKMEAEDLARLESMISRARQEGR
jgi:BlaI family transcriptional regulator, penicillinase repressor